MRIGILTFHWATNYGAVLQCFALQSYLISQGHDVEVINYKPLKYNDNLYNFIRDRKFLHLSEYLNNREKEKALRQFREDNLKLTELVHSCNSLPSVVSKFDVIISGSDQVANPSFLMHGEGRNVVSPTYYIGFPFSGKRVGYALSFGCVTFPNTCLSIASKYISKFNNISVRENSGINIIESMGRTDSLVVPDPTLLLAAELYNTIVLTRPMDDNYIYCFFIRKIKSRKRLIDSHLHYERLLWNSSDGDYTLGGWISKIKSAKYVLTDSFHCVVMCLKLHKPFIVITDYDGNIGMNDRLYTLLDLCGLSSRIIWKDVFMNAVNQLYTQVDWEHIDSVLEEYAKIGKEFLKLSLR